MKTVLASLSLAIVAAGICGCSCIWAPEMFPEWHSPLDPKLEEATHSAIRRRCEGNPGQDFHVLLLSGGGAWGAWGAGVLRGWREHPTDPRPAEFDVVTGVSVGAVMATHAFLGEPADDEVLAKAATTTHNGSIFFPKPVTIVPYAMFIPNLWFNSASWANSFLNTNSAASNEPLRTQVARLLPDDTIRRVAEAGRSGRRLLVATTRLDTGTMHIWDMTETAAGDDPGRFERYRTIILASMAVPIAMPPVEIDGAFHVDGAVRGDVLLEPDMLPPAGPLSRRRTVVHVVVNQRLSVPAEPGCERSSVAMVSRTLRLVFNASLVGNLYRTRYVAVNRGAEFRLCPIPETYTELNPHPEDFCPRNMRRLYDFGVEWARGHRWDASLSPRAGDGPTGPARSAQP